MIQNLKIMGFVPVHYMGSYFFESLLSIEPYVDKVVVAYSRAPSQSHGNNTPCPDKEEDIYNTALKALGSKLVWDAADSYHMENAHRDVRYKYSEGYDVCISTDVDEVFLNIPKAVEYLMKSGAQYAGTSNYINFFRSFEWYTSDSYSPIRLENLHVKTGFQDLGCPLKVLHFSCAQTIELTRYKLQNFGHASEIKPNYLEEIFLKWTPENQLHDLHPVAVGIWETQFYDKETMPDYLKAHPHFNKHIIE